MTAGLLALGGGMVQAAPETAPWPTSTAGTHGGCAAAAVSGWYATSESAGDRVEIRDIRGELRREITRDEMAPLLNWMTLDSSGDGPSALAWSRSGRSLFIAVHDDESGPGGGGGSDAVLRYDTVLGTLGVFALVDLGDETVSPAHDAALLHHAGRLYIGGSTGVVEVHRAERNDTSSFLPLATVDLGAPVRGLAADRALGLLYAATDTMLWRSPLSAVPPVFEEVGPLLNTRAIAHSGHYGGFSTTGLYAIDDGGNRVLHIPDVQAAGLLPYSPATYLNTAETWHDLASTACGRLLAAGDTGSVIVSDSTDNRPGFEAWLEDEFAQVVVFAKGLVSPEGEPSGWVIDADVATGAALYHPASPDGAAWVVLALLMNDHLYGDPEARGLVREILSRYAGLAGDGINPVRSADGIYHHWIDPATGGVKPGWPDELATLSTMKIVLAADRARRFYPTDPVVVAAADAIIGGVTNWSSYIQPGTDALYFRADPGGGPTGGPSGAFHEGIIFVEQAAEFGGASESFDRWITRGLWPTASYVGTMPVTTNQPGVHLAAFVSLYSWLVQDPFRESPQWGEHIGHLLGSNSAWTDDRAPRYMTVFSAGTTKTEWGGYNADSLSDHPGDITTFPSLMAFCADGTTAPAVSAYHAFRYGARQGFRGGASILYRRSEIDPGYAPNTAGLPDVVLGGLGLAELIRPGAVDAVLAAGYGETRCVADLAPPAGVLDLSDISVFVNAFISQGSAADLVEPFGVLDLADVNAFVASFAAGCP